MPPTGSSPDITGLLLAWNAGDEEAFDQLVPLVHSELKRLAVHYMSGEREDHTLQASALVNEAYLKLLDTRRVRWRNRTHFFALSARLMRRILVDFARHNRYQKRGGGAQKLPFDENLMVTKDAASDLVALDDALTALGIDHERAGKVVEMRYFGGLTTEEVAEVLSISTDTVLRDWRFAKTWLLRELKKEKAQ